ncbi:hypothetical protein HPB52_021978 [Rhipicephalus sanguineus]|uniref:Tick transposon n=1 Tax=Rhipicephalus sanguineus TaxID=34632 RepID=A0A9D4PP95_RHISA|nr:hypothetical protein HPB52_021978 [Rhipicephalus sanguineus]
MGTVPAAPSPVEAASQERHNFFADFTIPSYRILPGLANIPSCCHRDGVFGGEGRCSPWVPFDARVLLANGQRPKLLPETGLTRRERAALLRLRTGCVWTAARRYAKGRCISPACNRCGDPGTLEYLLSACPGLAQERSRVTTAYRRQGLPASTLEHILYPSRPHLPALRSLVEFLEETGIAAYR